MRILLVSGVAWQLTRCCPKTQRNQWRPTSTKGQQHGWWRVLHYHVFTAHSSDKAQFLQRNSAPFTSFALQIMICLCCIHCRCSYIKWLLFNMQEIEFMKRGSYTFERLEALKNSTENQTWYCGLGTRNNQGRYKKQIDASLFMVHSLVLPESYKLIYLTLTFKCVGNVNFYHTISFASDTVLRISSN